MTVMHYITSFVLEYMKKVEQLQEIWTGTTGSGNKFAMDIVFVMFVMYGVWWCLKSRDCVVVLF